VSGPPEPHAAFLRSAVARLGEDPRLVGIAGGGSYLARTMDEFSDLDLVIAVEPEAYPDFLGFLRAQVLGPLSLKLRGAPPSGVRRLELRAPDLAEEMRSTLAAHDFRSCARALRSAAEMDRRLRQALAAEALVRRTEAEHAAMAYLGQVSARTS